MADETDYSEEGIRLGLARLLTAAVDASGRAKCEVAADARLHKDALRRVLQAERSATLGEALRILEASRATPRAHLLLFLVCGEDQAIDWLQSDLAEFFEEFSAEFPQALQRSLGDNVGDVKSRWAKGTANRVARMLADHINELARKDQFLGDFLAGGQDTANV
ncbi:hypothetical protein D2V17_20085 [Aurantiacibacter xanthus]|uniref:Uncharacterized protein n=1 Tax=Aurantiacibacter xanthus TaxID=1784712 RepID=A0A3A1P406_9SPHN|nr:hypothetical protein [Aurantiacibacter xanthus]RIV80152.1 hypothetical protein D2V17_20085 [Aurantiacibacter xanthus]